MQSLRSIIIIIIVMAPIEDGDENDDVFPKLFCHIMLMHSICFWVVKENHG